MAGYPDDKERKSGKINPAVLIVIIPPGYDIVNSNKNGLDSSSTYAAHYVHGLEKE